MGSPQIKNGSLLVIALLGACAPILSSALLKVHEPLAMRTPVPSSPPVIGASEMSGFSAHEGQSNVSLWINVTADAGVASVILYYQVAGTVSWIKEAMNYTDGKYFAWIGSFWFGENVSYYVNATDALGIFTCSPVNAPHSFYTLIVPGKSIPSIGIDWLILIMGLFFGLGALVVLMRKELRRNLTGLIELHGNT